MIYVLLIAMIFSLPFLEGSNDSQKTETAAATVKPLSYAALAAKFEPIEKRLAVMRSLIPDETQYRLERIAVRALLDQLLAEINYSNDNNGMCPKDGPSLNMRYWYLDQDFDVISSEFWKKHCPEAAGTQINTATMQSLAASKKKRVMIRQKQISDVYLVPRSINRGNDVSISDIVYKLVVQATVVSIWYAILFGKSTRKNKANHAQEVARP